MTFTKNTYIDKMQNCCKTAYNTIKYLLEETCFIDGRTLPGLMGLSLLDRIDGILAPGYT